MGAARGGESVPTPQEQEFTTYTVETTMREGEAIHNEVVAAARAGMEAGSIDGMVLDSTRYARLAVYMAHDAGGRPLPGANDPDSHFAFDLHAVHAGGAEVCEPLTGNARKMWEACGDD